MSLLNYDAINLAEKDLQFGRDYLEQMRHRYHLPFVSANIYERATGELFTQSHVIKEINGLKLGIFGVTKSDGVERIVTPETGFEIRDPITAARSVVANLRKECDVLIALTHLGLSGSISLAEKVAGIDIIVSGHNGSHLKKPQRVGNTVIMQPGSKGKYLGHIDLKVTSGTISSIDGKTVALSKKISDDAALARVIKEYEDEVLEIFPTESAKAKTNYSLLSEKACIGCHSKQHSQWRSTLHAQAWATLVAKKQTHNPECQQCHTTMFGEPNGFARLQETPDMVNVQCSACHRLVSGDMATHINRFRTKRRGRARVRRHLTNGETNNQSKDFVAITEKTCLKCHNEDNSPDFDYEKFSAKVTH